MSTVTIVYESQYGQTEKIARRVAELAKAGGHDVRLRRVAEARASDVETADAVVLLAPVYNRRHADAAYDFATAHRLLLDARPTAFVSVSLAAAFKKGRFARDGAPRFIREFLDATRIRPAVVAAIAGGLNYPAYPRGFRFVMRLASYVLRLPTDASRAHELTDWAEVERVTRAFLATVGASAPRRPDANA